MAHRVSGVAVLPISSAIPWIASVFLPTQDLPLPDGPPAAAKVLLVKDEVSSAIDTSERKSISRDHVTEANGSCMVWSNRSSSPTKNAPELSTVR